MNVNALSDKELMARYQHADCDIAFDELYKRYQGKVMGYIMKKIQNPAIAQEIHQNSFLKFHQNRAKYNESIPVSAWIFIIVKRTIIDFVRKNKKYKKNLPIESVPELPMNATHEERINQVNFEGLSEVEKNLIKRKYFDGESYAEISRDLSKSEVSLRARVSRAIRKLRMNIKEIS